MHDRLDKRSCSMMAITIALGALLFSPKLAADPLSLLHRSLDEEFQDNLQELAGQCRNRGLVDAEQTILAWIIRRDPQRQYFFLTTDAPVDQQINDLSGALENWQQQFVQYRCQYAERLYELVGQWLEAGDAAAYRALFEVLHADPDHKEARRILGYKLVGDRWQSTFSRKMLQAGRVNHLRFGWIPQDHLRRYESGQRYFRGRWISAEQEERFRGRVSQGWRVETEHYVVQTNHSLEAGVELGRQLEMVYDVWRQLFVKYYATDKILARRMRGELVEMVPRRKYKVVFYRNQDEYVRSLKKHQPRIEMTLGIYLGRQRTAYFYASDDDSHATLCHEATHQLFHENGPGRQRSADDVGLDHNFWIVEGVALYFESLQLHDGYATLGGVDASRLQYARHNLLYGGFYEPLQRLAGLGRNAMQNHKNIRLLYSQAAGLTQFLMHDQQGAFHPALVEYIQSVYQRRDRDETLARLTGTSFLELDHAYREFLEVEDKDLSEPACLSSTRRLLLGGTRITDSGVAGLASATQLEDLNVAGTAITDSSLAVFARLVQMRELDISGTRISDTGLQHLRSLQQLRILSLSETSLTDQCIPYLGALKNLEQLYLKNTQITRNGLHSLQQLLPSVKIENESK